MKNQVWILWGETGDYEYYYDFIIDIFSSKEKADLALQTLKDQLIDLKVYDDQLQTYVSNDLIAEVRKIFKSHISGDTGVRLKVSGAHEVK